MIIGKLNIHQPVALAPMEGVTDLSFRLICKQLGADIVYSEFISSEGLIRNSEKAKKKMQFLDEERPIGLQIYGGLESSMISAAEIAEQLQPDFIDINAGCWVKNVVKQKAGAALLKDLLLMEKLISAVVLSVQLPVTVKTRLGWDQNNIKIVEVAKMLESIGVSALTVHCRTRIQAHKGEVDYSWIPKIKEVTNIPIIVNGGINSPEKAKYVFDTTGCDGIMIGQAAIDNPFIFREIKYYLTHSKLPEKISLNEKIETMIKHLKLSVFYKGEKRGVIEFRKYYTGYLHSFPNAARIRNELMKLTKLDDILEKLYQLTLINEVQFS